MRGESPRTAVTRLGKPSNGWRSRDSYNCQRQRTLGPPSGGSRRGSPKGQGGPRHAPGGRGPRKPLRRAPNVKVSPPCRWVQGLAPGPSGARWPHVSPMLGRGAGDHGPLVALIRLAPVGAVVLQRPKALTLLGLPHLVLLCCRFERDLTFTLAHRALAARLAMAFRSSGESFALRLLPPSRPKIRAASRIISLVSRVAMARTILHWAPRGQAHTRALTRHHA